MSEIVRLATPEAVAEEAARRWVQVARSAAAERGQFSIALSGGSTPIVLYELMRSEPWRSEVPWDQTFVFWGDERRVRTSSTDSNYRMAREAFLDHVPIPSEHIFRMPGEGLASSDARSYDQKIRRHFNLGLQDWPRFDLFLLGMGSDGHVASVFPGTRAVSDRSNMVLAYEVPQLHVERITLTLPAINHARNVLILVMGQEKAETLARVLRGPTMPSTYPAQAVQPMDGTLVWLVDAAAYSGVEELEAKASD